MNTEAHHTLNTALEQLDEATSYKEWVASDRSGLMLPVNDESLYAAKWGAPMPSLPPEVAGLSPFDIGEPVEIHTRYRYGEWQTLINIWFNNLPGFAFEAMAFSLAIDPETGDEKLDSNMSNAGGHGEKSISTNRELTQAVLGSVFTGYQPTHSQNLANHYRSAITAQTRLGAELYTVETAEKVFSIYSQVRDVVLSNAFELKVQAIDRTHPNGKRALTRIALARSFEGEAYDDGTLFSGRLYQDLEIETAPSGEIITARRASRADLFNDPVVMIVNEEEQVIALNSKADVSELPAAIQQHMYADETPTSDDFAFFERLMTQPPNETDLYL